MIKGEVYQFLSRSNISNFPTGVWNTSLAGQPEIIFKINYQVCDKPFEINFANIHPSNPSIGAHEYIDPNLDQYTSKRWPKCIKGIATINGPSTELQNTHTMKQILHFLRTHLWAQKKKSEYSQFIKQNMDQVATTPGYRREYFNQQFFDIDGNRRPSSTRYFVPAKIGDYVGPGLSCFPGVIGFNSVNEMVWSQIIPFKDRKDLKADLPILEEKIMAIGIHLNSYTELESAKRYLKDRDIKACVRFAANSVEAILRYYCEAWEIKFPENRHLQFDEKIENILINAEKPSYKKVDSGNLQTLLYLYRARNSQHKCDCSFTDASGKLVRVTKLTQAAEFVTSAEAFTLWIDTIV